MTTPSAAEMLTADGAGGSFRRSLDELFFRFHARACRVGLLSAANAPVATAPAMPRMLIKFVALCLSLSWFGTLYALDGEPVRVGDAPSYALSGEVSVYRHNGEPLELDQARERFRSGRFRPPSGSPSATNFGLTRDEIWLRVGLATAAELPRRWLLEVGHASLDVVDVWVAERGATFAHQHSGDRIPFSAKPLSHRHHVFPLTLEPDTGYTLYLRVASEGTLTAPVTLWQPDALWRHDQLSYSLLSAYYGLLLGLLVYNLFLFLSLRDPLYLIYAAFIGTLAVGQAGLAGFTGQFVWPDNPWLAHLSPTGGVSAAGIFGALFVQRFLGETPRSLRLHWFMPSISAGYAVTLACAVLWSYHWAALAVNLLSLVFAAGALGMGAVSLYRRQPGARFFVLAWLSLLSGVVVIALHNLGVLPSNVYTANALLIGSAAEMLLLSLALADRINDIQHAHDRAQAEAIAMKQRMLETVRENERVLEQRVAERTVELENTNRRLQESQALLQRQANHDALTGLANRKLLQDRLAGARARADRQGVGFAFLMADLDRFKAVNDGLGHSAGDEVLVEVARRLRAAARESDTVARVGGDEFVLVLESVRCREDAERTRDALLRAVAEPIRLSAGESVTVGVSVGVTLYPTDSCEVEALLQLADQAMYREKESGRRTLNAGVAEGATAEPPPA